MIKLPSSKATLADILEAVGENDLHWSLLHIWATVKPTAKIDIFSIEEKTRHDSDCNLDWRELLEISADIEQLIDCTITAVLSPSQRPSRDLSTESLIEKCEVVIEAVDSSFWEISVKDKALNKRFMSLLTTE